MVLRNGLVKLNFQAIATTQDIGAGRIAVSHTILCITPYFFKTYKQLPLVTPELLDEVTTSSPGGYGQNQGTSNIKIFPNPKL